MDARYHYFVSYSHDRGLGSNEVYLDRPLTTWDQFEQIRRATEDRIAGKYAFRPHVVILNYQLLSGPDTAAADAAVGRLRAALADIERMVHAFDTPRDAGRVSAFVGDVGHIARKALED